MAPLPPDPGLFNFEIAPISLYLLMIQKLMEVFDCSELERIALPTEDCLEICRKLCILKQNE
jgi:hypothetical protein